MNNAQKLIVQFGITMTPLQGVSAHDSPQQHSALRDMARLRLTDRQSQSSILQLQTASKRQRKADALRVLLQSAPSVMQDLAVQAAEAVAVCFMAEARSGSNGKACSINHSLIRSFIRLFVRSFVRSFIPSFIHSFIHSFIPSFIHSIIHLIRVVGPTLTVVTIHSFVHSFINSFIHSIKGRWANYDHLTNSLK